MTDTEAIAMEIPDTGNLKRYFYIPERNHMNKNILESDTKDSAISQENVIHQKSRLEKPIELNTKTIGMMAQMLDSMM